MMIKDMTVQPHRLDDRIVLEKRKPDGTLDFADPQPPLSVGNRCACCQGLRFRDVYTIFFQAPENKEIISASWAQLKEWLDARGWVVRARTW